MSHIFGYKIVCMTQLSTEWNIISRQSVVPPIMQGSRTQVNGLLHGCGTNVIDVLSMLLGLLCTVQRNSVELSDMRIAHFEVLHMFSLHDRDCMWHRLMMRRQFSARLVWQPG